MARLTGRVRSQPLEHRNPVRIMDCSRQPFKREELMDGSKTTVPVGQAASSLAPSVAAAATPSLPWYRTITRQQWQALIAAKLGWMLDAMDFVLYLMALTTLQEEFDFGLETAGLLATVSLLTSAAGGMLFGVVADKIGRTRALMATI